MLIYHIGLFIKKAVPIKILIEKCCQYTSICSRLEKLELEEKDDLREVSGDLTVSSLNPILGIGVLTCFGFAYLVSLCCVTVSTFHFMLYDFLEMIVKLKFLLPLALLLSPPENSRIKDCLIQAMEHTVHLICKSMLDKK